MGPPADAGVLGCAGWYVGGMCRLIRGNAAAVAVHLAPFAAVLAAFAWFVQENGGVVVGDRAAHAPVFHLPQ